MLIHTSFEPVLLAHILVNITIIKNLFDCELTQVLNTVLIYNPLAKHLFKSI
jgi:hypothetical protein